MPQLFLFGSRARHEHHEDSDFDVYVIGATEELLNLLEPYSLERGGNLDLFTFAGDCLLAAYDEDGIRRIFGKWDLYGVSQDAIEITLFDLLSDPNLRIGNVKQA